MVAVVDYGMGNVHSMAKAIEHVGGEALVTSRDEDLATAERIVLPGVGAFGECMANLRRTGLVAALERSVLGERKPFLGVCVGMQLLAREGLEHGVHEGLGWIDARVVQLERPQPWVRIPHTGWNEVEPAHRSESPLDRIRPGEAFYFNHSYHVVPADPELVAIRCDYGQPVVAALGHANVITTQFHPEKSQRAGLELLADFLDWSPEAPRDQAIRTSTP